VPEKVADPDAGGGGIGKGRVVGRQRSGEAHQGVRGAKTIQGAASQGAILRAAQDHFSRGGYRGSSLAEIAESASLSQPGLLHHFPSKPALLLAVLAHRDEVDGHLSSARLGGAGTGIVDALRALVEHNQTTPELVRLFSVLLGEALARDHPAHGYFIARYRRIRARIVRNLGYAVDDNQMPTNLDLPAVASALIAVMDGLQYQWLLDDEVDMVSAFEAIVGLVEDGLRWRARGSG